MGMFRYKFKVANSANFYGHGFHINNNTDPLILNLTPHFDFYNGATLAFRVCGISFLTSKNMALRAVFDSSVGNEYTFEQATLPTSLDRIRVYELDASGNPSTFGADLVSSTVDSAVGLDVQGYDVNEATDASGNYTRFTVLKGDSTTYTAGSPPAVSDELIAEFSGAFTHVRCVIPFPAWQHSTAYDQDNAFSAHIDATGNNSPPKLYIPNSAGTATNTATDFDTWVSDNSLTFLQEVTLGSGVFAVEQMSNFNATTTNRFQLGDTQDDNEIIILHEEPKYYLDTTAGTNGNGYSRQDPYNTLPTLNDNDVVLVMAGSTIGSDTFSDDAILTVQNGVVGSGGGGGTGLLAGGLVKSTLVG